MKETSETQVHKKHFLLKIIAYGLVAWSLKFLSETCSVLISGALQLQRSEQWGGKVKDNTGL